MKQLRVFISAILAGIVFSIGGAVYLRAAETSIIAAALLFAGGLLAVQVFKLHLFTDKVGYLFLSPGKADSRIVGVFVTLIGNIVGAATVGIALSTMLKTSVLPIVDAKLTAPPLITFIYAILCGMLMFVAVHGYRRQNGGFTGSLILTFATAAFVICGFEHSVANMFYFAVAMRFDMDAIIFILITALGNALGAIVFAELYEAKKESDEERYRRHHRHHHSENSENKN